MSQNDEGKKITGFSGGSQAYKNAARKKATETRKLTKKIQELMLGPKSKKK